MNDEITTFFRSARFVTSISDINQAPPDVGEEIAFFGRSNAGKSSVINALTEQKRLAITSKLPGRTRTINFFALTDSKRLVDLPGYGYANTSHHLAAQLVKLITAYLHKRDSLRGLVLITDIRHALKPADQLVLEQAVKIGVPTLIVLNKSDKLGFGAVKCATEQTRLQQQSTAVVAVSAHNRAGMPELRTLLAQWLHLFDESPQ